MMDEQRIKEMQEAGLRKAEEILNALDLDDNEFRLAAELSSILYNAGTKIWDDMVQRGETSNPLVLSAGVAAAAAIAMTIVDELQNKVNE